MRNIRRARAAAVLCAALAFAGCATAGEYQGYGGYHTYKTDTSTKKRMAVLVAFFTPVMLLPSLYLLNQIYIHNTNIHNIFVFMGIDGFFKKMGEILPH